MVCHASSSANLRWTAETNSSAVQIVIELQAGEDDA